MLVKQVHSDLESLCVLSADSWISPVARIAYIASDVIFSVQPALGLDSDFSPHLHAFAANEAPGLVGNETPEVSNQLEDLRWN